MGVQACHFDLAETTARRRDFLAHDKGFVFLAQCEKLSPVGFVARYERYALYAEGAFGTIPEAYVRPTYRTNKLGLRLMSQAKSFGTLRGWTR